MCFFAGAKDQVMNNRATCGIVGKFAQRTADLLPGVIGQKVQAGAEEEYHHNDSIPEELIAVPVSHSEKSSLDMDYWTSQRSNAKSKPGIQWVDLVTLSKTGTSVSALRWLRSLPTRHQPVLIIQWSICAWARRTGTVSPVTSPSSIWRWMMLTGEKLPQMTRKEEAWRCWERRGRGMRRSKWRKREFLMNQVDFQQGLSSFWCIYWSCVFQLLSGTQNSVIFNITLLYFLYLLTFKWLMPWSWNLAHFLSVVFSPIPC